MSALSGPLSLEGEGEGKIRLVQLLGKGVICIQNLPLTPALSRKRRGRTERSPR